jgi:6-phosphogluconolactonase
MDPAMNITIFKDIDAVAISATDRIEAEIRSVDRLALGLAGGSTPKRVHRELAARPIDWSGVTTWMTDARWVPATHEDANQRMARETLVDATGVHLLAPDKSLESPNDSAEDFTRTLVEAGVPTAPRSIIMLGMGPDGHTASLFPGTDALKANGERYVANHVPQLDTWRLTATFGLIATADEVIFLVTGGNKADAIREIRLGSDLPAGRVTCRGNVVWLLDEAAAQGL